jgi:rhamnosyltransferase
VAASASVVIPTKNGGPRFRECLAAVRRQVLDRPFDVVVIDSGSTDDTRGYCREFDVRLLEIDPSTFNHGTTRNQAIAAAAGEYVALLTQDAVPLGTDWLQHLVDALDEAPRAAGAYGQQVMRAEVTPYMRWRLGQWAATRQTRVVQELGDAATFERLPALEKLGLVAFDNVNSCVRRRVWEAIPFQHVPFGEDIDWGVRALRAGHAIVYEPGARVEHSHNDSIWRDFKRVYADHRNLNRLLGMRQVPTLGTVARCTLGGVSALWRDVPLDAYGPGARLYWRLYAVPWVFAQNAAQYLGAGANERRGRALWSWIDAVVG